MHSGRATFPIGGAACTQDTSGNYSGWATPIDPLGAGPIPM